MLAEGAGLTSPGPTLSLQIYSFHLSPPYGAGIPVPGGNGLVVNIKRLDFDKDIYTLLGGNNG